MQNRHLYSRERALRNYIVIPSHPNDFGVYMYINMFYCSPHLQARLSIVHGSPWILQLEVDLANTSFTNERTGLFLLPTRCRRLCRSTTAAGASSPTRAIACVAVATSEDSRAPQHFQIGANWGPHFWIRNYWYLFNVVKCWRPLIKFSHHTATRNTFFSYLV